MAKPPARACGTCTACCSALAVPEVRKEQDTACPHLAARGGCGIYAERPSSCRAFSCVWLRGVVPAQYRPDRTGVVFDVTEVRGGSDLPQAMVAHELFPGASRDGDGYQACRFFVQAGLAVIVREYGSDNRRVMGPPELVRRYQAAILTRKVAGV